MHMNERTVSVALTGEKFSMNVKIIFPYI